MKLSLLVTTALLAASTGAFAESPALTSHTTMSVPHPIVAPMSAHPAPIAVKPVKSLTTATPMRSTIRTPVSKYIAPGATAKSKRTITLTTPLRTPRALGSSRIIGTLTPVGSKTSKALIATTTTPVKKGGGISKPEDAVTVLDWLKQAQKDEAQLAKDQKSLTALEQQTEKDRLNIGNQIVNLTPDVARAQVNTYLADLAALNQSKNLIARDQNLLQLDNSALGHGAPPPAPRLNGIVVPNGPISATQKTVLTSEIAKTEQKDAGALTKATTDLNKSQAALNAAVDKVAQDLASNQLLTFKQDLQAAVDAKNQQIKSLSTLLSANAAFVQDRSEMQKLNSDPVK